MHIRELFGESGRAGEIVIMNMQLLPYLLSLRRLSDRGEGI